MKLGRKIRKAKAKILLFLENIYLEKFIILLFTKLQKLNF